MLRLVLLWTASLSLLPILIIEALWTKKTALRLPEAFGDRQSPSRESLHIIGLGDSVIAGVGISDMAQTITPSLANNLSARCSQKVSWCALGSNGDKSADLLNRVKILEVDKPDLVLVSIGVNDVSHLTSMTRWQFQIATLIADLKDKYHAPIVFIGLPPMGKFPALPQPLRFSLGVRAAMLDLTLKQASQVLKDVHWVELGKLSSNLSMAEDGYHPSAEACIFLADFILDELESKGLNFKASR